MSIYDKAHELAKALKSNDEIIEYKKLKEELEKDEGAKKMVEDFQKRQFELQLKLQKGEEAQDEKKKIEELYKILMTNNLANRYIQKEIAVAIIMQDISKIISDAIEV